MNRTDLFAERYVDLDSSAAPAVVASRLREHGLVTVDGLDSRNHVLDFAARILNLVPHRDSDPDGLTVIHDTGRHNGQPGFAGLGTGALAAHTEGSGVLSPPRLMLIACARPAEEGGTCLLTDGRAVHADLLTHHPDAVEALSEDGAGFFGGQDGVFAPVLQHTPNGHVSLRLRLDDLVWWNPLVLPYIRTLTETVVRCQQALPLDAGEAYLIDNSRWLHARTAFAGPRLLYRALGTPHVPLPDGFPATAPGEQPHAALGTA